MSTEFTAYQEKINKYENILIIYGAQASFSAVSFATSLFLWCKDLKKNVFLASPSEPTVELCNFVGINKVKKYLPKQNLVIKMPYDENKVAKVLSDLNQNRNELSIVIKPQPGCEPIEQKEIKLTYQTGDYDLVFLIGVEQKDELNQLCRDNEKILQNPEKLLAINDFTSSCPFMSHSMKQLSKNASYASWWGQLLQVNQMAISADQASNLLMGLEKETDNFSNQDCTPENFELAAWLMRQGGTRHRVDEGVSEAFSAQHHLPKVNLKV